MGKLYICATPIGNLEDVSLRLLRILKEVDFIACEDTRRTIKILNYYHIKTKLISYHKFSSIEKEKHIIEQILEGKNAALVTDAGTPGISDPGHELIKRAIEAEVDLEIIPGPAALICALIASGLDSSRFLFMGFLAAKKAQRQEEMAEIEKSKRTVIIYEAPHRILRTMNEIEQFMGADRHIVIVKEITKLHEEIIRGPVNQVKEFFINNSPRGEFCLLIKGKEFEENMDINMVLNEVEYLIKRGMTKKQALKTKAQEYKLKKSDLYKLLNDN